MMNAQTVAASTTNTIREVLHGMSKLSDSSIKKLAEYVRRLIEEQETEETKAEIAALEAKHRTAPNAETIAAMEEGLRGGGVPMTLEEIRAECEALRPMLKR
jgi:phage shock protein A